MKIVPTILRNRYLLAFTVFMVWMLFFDRNDIFSQWASRKELKKLEADKAYYLEQIEQNKKDMKELMSDKEHLEKYAREHYLMKKDNEEIFLILPDTVGKETEYKE